MSVDDVLDGDHDPTDFFDVSQPVLKRFFCSQRLCLAILNTIERVNILFVGLLLLPLTPDRLANPFAIARTFGVAVIATALAGIFLRAMQPANDSLSGSSYPVAVCALQAAVSVAFAFIVVAACRLIFQPSGSTPAPLLLWCAMSATVAALLQFPRSIKHDVLIIGDEASAATLACKLQVWAGAERIKVVATLDPSRSSDLARLDHLVATGHAATVIVAPNVDDVTLTSLCVRLSDTPARLRLSLTGQSSQQSPFATISVGQAAPVQLIDLLPHPISGWRLLAKRTFDLAVAILLLPLLIPLFAIVASAIYLESPGPILFRQWRFGQGSKPVLIFKFRTMHTNLSDLTGATRTLSRDPRVTRIGRILRRLSIDETPQLLNVLRGEMSLVGPRPHPTHMKVEGVFYYEAVEAYRARHRMLPGITGWAQVNGSRGEIDTIAKARRRLELDLWYISNWSPLLDLWIVLRTAMGGFATLRSD